MSGESGVPLEDFIQALTSQLDRAQTTMALKARAGLPLTFAVKDLKLDLKAHVQVVRNAVHIRPAGPQDSDASTLRLELTTITRPMIEENTLEATAAASSEPTIEEFFKENTGQEISEEDQRRLEWAGVHTISQLRRLERGGTSGALRRVAGTPVERLRAALAKADSPVINRIQPELPGSSGKPRRRLRISGRNLMWEGVPDVTINGATTPVLEARPDEIVVEHPEGASGGTITVRTAPGLEMALAFDLDDTDGAVGKEDGNG
jgi:hypothetical protein